jgi:hypothetical protein
MTPQNFVTLPREVVEQALNLVAGPNWGTVGYMDMQVYNDASKLEKQLRAALTEQVQPAQGTAGAKMPCGAVVTNVYDAYEAGKKAALLQSNAERVPLSDEQINRLWNDSFIGADPTSGNQRFKFARAIEAEIKKGQQ